VTAPKVVTAPKLTVAQRKVLLNIAVGRDPGDGLQGRSAWGGLHRTLWSLRRHGFVRDGKVTDAGRAALRGGK